MSFLEKLKNKKVLIGAGVITIIVLATGIFIYNKNKINNEKLGETENYIETYTIADNEKVFINGKILPTESKDFNPSSEGEVSKLNVTNGKIVKKGDLLFTCKNDAVLNEIDGLKSQVSELKKSNSSDDPLINTEISKLNAQISTLDKKAYINTYAPFDGKVYLNEKSENAAEPTSFITLQSNQYYMKGQASEQDLSKLQIDDPVNVLVFSTDKKVTGRISFISDRPSSQANDMNMGGQGSLSYYDISISFDDQEGLVNGFHVQASIEIRDSLSKIPTSCILRDENDKPYVFESINGILKKQIVEIASTDEELTVVKSGLDKNDVLVRYPSEGMKEGDAINAGDTPSNDEGMAEKVE
ncbi:efflux RND transporter periplasmic adaptor subunit [Clostridium sp. CCUG 7971]|uniref:efflux RND transporter periplasmic adaptor subunit n=1 Tax=Clostridium sp. CCUG 7971 TaxID=2811414 RepID=UPI001ABA5B44|nr:efflux RND transporter periplasmic adaptor subunit [Clostridium sp. CCUG 7971]MBO3446038.1 efflux RND transporter periplasmic adaptor subunit [Clostridium sp. CCUG 7971]